MDRDLFWGLSAAAVIVLVIVALVVGGVHLVMSPINRAREAECMGAGGSRYERMRRIGPTCWTEDGRRVWVKEWE